MEEITNTFLHINPVYNGLDGASSTNSHPAGLARYCCD